MTKRSVFTTLTPLPKGITRAVVLETLHNHAEMIDLNPLVETRYQLSKPPAKSSAEEYYTTWYEMIDRISYLPGVKGKVTYQCSFHDLSNGLQTHCYAPMGLDIRDRWTVGGNEPGEPRQPVELGLQAPKDGLWLREDVDMRCNFMMTGFVKKNLVNAHSVLVDRLVEKAKLVETKTYNESLTYSPTGSTFLSAGRRQESMHSPSTHSDSGTFQSSDAHSNNGYPYHPDNLNDLRKSFDPRIPAPLFHQRSSSQPLSEMKLPEYTPSDQQQPAPVELDPQDANGPHRMNVLDTGNSPSHETPAQAPAELQ